MIVYYRTRLIDPVALYDVQPSVPHTGRTVFFVRKRRLANANRLHIGFRAASTAARAWEDGSQTPICPAGRNVLPSKFAKGELTCSCLATAPPHLLGWRLRRGTSPPSLSRPFVGGRNDNHQEDVAPFCGGGVLAQTEMQHSRDGWECRGRDEVGE